MALMLFRSLQLENTLNGLNSTGVPLVNLQGSQFSPSGYSDDIGLYYFVPAVSRFFGIPVQEAASLFLWSLLLGGSFLAIYGMCKIFKNWGPRIICALGFLGLSFLEGIKVADIYVVMIFAVNAVIPICLAWGKEGGEKLGRLWPWFVFWGLMLGYCDFIRAQSGMGAVLFIALWLFLNGKISWKNKVLCLILLLASYQVSNFHFKFLVRNRDQFLQKAVPGYGPAAIRHPYWGNMYIGLGYLDNPYGIEYRDNVAVQKARSIDPKIVPGTQEEEDILRKVVLEFIQAHPAFVAKTLLAKFLRLLKFFLVFANFGVLFWFYVRPPWRETAPLAITAVFYSIPGLLVVPLSAYVLGMIAVAVVFGVYMTGLGLEKYFQTTAAHPGPKQWLERYRLF